jgi:hypothetical protein
MAGVARVRRDPWCAALLAEAWQGAGLAARRTIDWWLRLRQQAWDRTHGGGSRVADSGAPGRLGRLGRPIGELAESDAFTLEVHRAVSVDMAGHVHGGGRGVQDLPGGYRLRTSAPRHVRIASLKPQAPIRLVRRWLARSVLAFAGRQTG